jgi:hypothetical protein
MRLIPTYRRAGHPAIHPVLHTFASEAQRTIVHLVAYMGVLALLVMAAVHLASGFDLDAAVGPAVARTDWSVAARSYPSFAVSQFDSAAKAQTYEILRHPGGGRRDVLRFAPAPGENPIAELELYRPGREAATAGPPDADGAGEGIVDSKFGPVALFARGDSTDSRRCLGFMKVLDAANLRISGFSCQGDSLPARRTAIACTLNRLVLLTAGNEPKLQEIFAHAELKRAGCSAGTVTGSADWVTGAGNPLLRGSL